MLFLLASNLIFLIQLYLDCYILQKLSSHILHLNPQFIFFSICTKIYSIITINRNMMNKNTFLRFPKFFGERFLFKKSICSFRS